MKKILISPKNGNQLLYSNEFYNDMPFIGTCTKLIEQNNTYLQIPECDICDFKEANVWAEIFKEDMESIIEIEHKKGTELIDKNKEIYVYLD